MTECNTNDRNERMKDRLMVSVNRKDRTRIRMLNRKRIECVVVAVWAAFANPCHPKCTLAKNTRPKKPTCNIWRRHRKKWIKSAWIMLCIGCVLRSRWIYLCEWDVCLCIVLRMHRQNLYRSSVIGHWPCSIEIAGDLLLCLLFALLIRIFSPPVCICRPSLSGFQRNYVRNRNQNAKVRQKRSTRAKHSNTFVWYFFCLFLGY